MQISKRLINKNIEKEVFNIFFQVIADLKDPEEVRVFFEDILGKAELTALAKRLAIAHYLKKGRSYQNIKEVLKVSSATIASVDKMRQKSPGFELALKKIEADRWAEKWSGKIEGLFSKK
jgi:TrpR-related protein YerC/YecD